MTGFHDILFPMKMARGAVGGPTRATNVKTSANGKESRNSALYNSRRRYEISSKGSSLDELSATLNFFEARMGRLFAFRFRDPIDNKSCEPSKSPSATDQIIGTGNGIATVFQLVKKYGDAKGDYIRNITKPVNNSVLVAISGNQIPQNQYSIDYSSGKINFNTPPANGVPISAGFRFDTMVRFDNDTLDYSLDGFEAGHLPSIVLVEVL